ncbi:Short-chain dehydrogenase/reductase SAT2 [Lachnellula suecica]|uniref:Short-chain dehydrogenase/reductase SAT2 n=1 Tax=Lachnellula suecica TaxID=602035 RepID=A0A8T9CFI9_9HELO|nr:Short-chain dehydrogenase/reductase SAT2 [Lachnellula suecica]
MVKLNLIKSANSTLVQSKPLVAVFVGGTSGVGRNTIISLAANHGKSGQGLRVYLIGRNSKAAEAIISECKSLCPSGQFLFIRAINLALLKEVDHVCEELVRMEEKEAGSKSGGARMDILVMTQAIFKPWDPRNGSFSLSSYHWKTLAKPNPRNKRGPRYLYITSLLFSHAVHNTSDASTLIFFFARTLFGPGRDTTLIEDDLSLRSPQNYGFMSSGAHAAYLTTFYLEHLAAQHPGKLSLSHYFPGLILHEGFQDPTFPWWFKTIFKYLAPVLRLFPSTLSSEECGARTLFNVSPRFPAREQGAKMDGEIGVAESSDGVIGGGAYRVNWNNEMVAIGKKYGRLRAEGWGEKIVNHTTEVFEAIEKGTAFTG